jgi:hypothetical protein
MKKILITNGSGGCGKDTLAELMSKYVDIIKYSSIDFFKELGTLGRMKTQKNEGERILLYNLKKAFIEYNELPTILCGEEIDNFLQNDENDILIIDVREPKEIQKLKELYPQIITVLVINKNVPVITYNSSDANVFDYVYDYVIDNSYTLGVLEESAITLLQELDFNIEREEK